MMMPKGWNAAPSTNWVSGTKIDPDGVKMPDLGTPDQHLDAAEEMSLYKGQMVKQCPPGTASSNGVCTPSADSEASLESKVKAELRTEKKGPEAPKEADAQIRRLSKMGVKGR